MDVTTLVFPPTLARFGRALAFGLIALSACLPLRIRAADAIARDFDLPAETAERALKKLSSQSGLEVLFATEAAAGVRTNAVKGRYFPLEAANRMLEGTRLEVARDDQSGALVVARRSHAPTEKNALGPEAPRDVKDARAATGPTAGAKERADSHITLDEFRVLGSRIRQTDSEGPSPVDTYDRAYINATGAMTLADFLNTLPQTYGGISAGRGSAPNELNIEYGRRSEGVTPAQPAIGGSPVLFAPPQTGVSGVSLRGLGAASTLVLIDGRRVVSSGVGNSATDSKQSFVDLNSIPLGLIDRIEVTTDGSSAIYGADAVAGVINIVLKKNYVGTEVTGTVKMTEHGGGRERQGTVTAGITSGRLRGTVSLNYYDRGTLYGSQRAFSRNMDHSQIIRNTDAAGNPIFGTDQRLQFGYPASVQVATGTLNGLSSPARVALTPLGVTTTPSAAQFIPITTIAPGQSTLSAQGQRPTDVSRYLEIVPVSERWGLTSNFNYAFSDRLEAYATFNYSDSRTKANALPAYNNLAATTIVPAAYSPFNQDVQIGMIHYEFGTLWQEVHTTTPRVSAGLRGTLRHDWQWDANASWQRRDLFQRSRAFNAAAVAAALANPDPAQRLNPFIDGIAAGLDRSAIYEKMAVYPLVDSESELTALDVSADGAVFTLPGGDVKAAIGASYDRQSNDNVRTNITQVAAPVTTVVLEAGQRTSYAGFTEISVPIFGKKNALLGLRRLEARAAIRYQDEGAAGSATVPKFGVTWSPIQSLLFRASYSEGFRVPSLTELQTSVQTIVGLATNDPRRGNVSTPVNFTGGLNPDLKPETSTNEFYGVVFEPAFAKGFNVKVNYYRTKQTNAIQQLGRPTYVNNEIFFADRITRAAPTAADIAAGFPGQLLEVRTSLINFGEVENESVDFSLEYRLPWEKLGRWRVTGNASKTLKSKRQLSPGQVLDDTGDTYSAPPWKALGTVSWSRGPLNLSGTVSYLGGFKSNRAGANFRALGDPAPAVRKFDARGGYEFQKGVWRGYGKNVRVSVGVSNVFDAKPPFYDVIYGYNAALHSEYLWGRTYEFSLALPF